MIPAEYFIYKKVGQLGQGKLALSDKGLAVLKDSLDEGQLESALKLMMLRNNASKVAERVTESKPFEIKPGYIQNQTDSCRLLEIYLWDKFPEEYNKRR